MAQDTFDDFDPTDSNNTSITGSGSAINMAEGMLPGLVNNGIRALMAACRQSTGMFLSGTSRPASLLASRFWLDTTTAASPILKWYDGTDDITFFTIDTANNTIDLASSVDASAATGAGGISNLSEDTTPQLGGDLDVNGNSIVSASNGDIVIEPNGTGDINLNAAIVTVEDDIVHAGDTNNLISFGTDTQSYETGGSSRLDISDSGVRLGGANARVTTILDEDDMSSDSATALATQQSIKAYVDANGGSITLGTAQTPTSVANADFTSIPSGVDKIVVMFLGLSTNGTDGILIQLGDSGGVETTGYVSSVGSFTAGGDSGNATNGFIVTNNAGASEAFSGSATLTRINGNAWVIEGGFANGSSGDAYGNAGGKTLSAELDRVRITTTGGTDNFDAGTVNIQYQ